MTIPLKEFRQKIRKNEYTGHTSGYYPEKAQFNVVILPKDQAQDFEVFCSRNPVPCPVVFRSEPGQFNFDKLGEIDIRRDIPAYYVYQDGELLWEKPDIAELWQDNFVVFCIGCSFTFDAEMIRAGITLSHVQQGNNVAMYKTSIPLNPSKLFNGNMVTSMRWIKPDQVNKAVEVTAKFPDFHGAPVNIGEPEKIGIRELSSPDYGDFTEPEEGDIPVFWGCGVTPQACLANAKLPLVITHKPGSMLITDLTHAEVIR